MFQKRVLALAVFGILSLCARAAQADINNGGFETGDITGWNVASGGSVQVLQGSQFMPLNSTEGAYFALIGNGPSDVGNDGLPDSGILTSDLFTVSSGGTLQFDYDCLTAEFTGSNADPMHLDEFAVFLLSPSGSQTTLVSLDVSSPTFFNIAAGMPSVAPDGTSVVEHTGVYTGSAFLTPGTYALGFQVSDSGDGSFDSALLVDNVRFVPAATVPEANAFSLWLSSAIVVGGTCLHATRRKQAKIPS